DGLKGNARAVEWDRKAKVYRVGSNKLAEYVKYVFENRMQKAGIVPNASDYQMPELIGPGNVVLATVDENNVGKLRLWVRVEPAKAAPLAQVRVYRTLPHFDAVRDNLLIPPPPVEFLLRPRGYCLEVLADGYERGGTDVLLCDDPQEEMIQLVEEAVARAPARPPTSTGLPPGGMSRPSFAPSTTAASTNGGSEALEDNADEPRPGGEATRGLTEISEVQVEARRPDGKVNLVVTTGGGLSPVELLDEAGDRQTPTSTTVVQSAGHEERTIHFDGLDEGFYKARMILPGAETKSKLIALKPGENTTLRLESPRPEQTRLTRDMVLAAELLSDWTTHELIAPDFSQALWLPFASSLLNVSAQSDPSSNASPARLLPRWGLEPFPGGGGDGPRSGIQVLIAAELEDPAAAAKLASQVLVRLWRNDDTVPRSSSLEGSPRVSGLASLIRPSEPGNYWLSVRVPDGTREIVFCLTVIEGYLTAVLFNFRERGEMKVYQTLGTLTPEAVNLEQLRRLDELERFYLAGRFDDCRDLARYVLELDIQDPIAGALGAFLSSNPIDEPSRKTFADFAGYMRSNFSSLADTHVILAEMYRLFKEDGKARDEYTAALQLGIPLLGPHVEKLRAGIDFFKIDGELLRVDQIRALCRDRVGSIPWSAWSPNEVQEGTVLRDGGSIFSD
ncbi:MAG TPA: hypothetical protein VKA15_06210, partial [Isosphaeraceae bacterium]|nr:hypothetical protein [Isosphaeraceae bacterium]